MALVAYAEPGNMIHSLYEQLQQYLDLEVADRVEMNWRRLQFPTIRDHLLSDLEAELKLQLNADPSERRLPEPFLRRCIFHHIAFSEALVRRAVEARIGDFPNLPEAVRETAIQRFLELRGREIRKKPATAELLVWLTVLAARGNVTEADLRAGPLAKLPALSTLIKDRDDLALLQ